MSNLPHLPPQGKARVMDWGDSLIDTDRLDTAGLPEILEAMQDLARLMELVLVGLQHSAPAEDSEAVVFSLLRPLQAALARAAMLERLHRAVPPGEPPPGPLHVVHNKEGA